MAIPLLLCSGPYQLKTASKLMRILKWFSLHSLRKDCIQNNRSNSSSTVACISVAADMSLPSCLSSEAYRRFAMPSFLRRCACGCPCKSHLNIMLARTFLLLVSWGQNFQKVPCAPIALARMVLVAPSSIWEGSAPPQCHKSFFMEPGRRPSC
jgi:hypothetical protein